MDTFDPSKKSTPNLESTFFTKPIKYKPGIRRGFIVKPHDDANPDGWGEPFEDEEGEAIRPGTPGGPNPNAILGVGENVVVNDDGSITKTPKWAMLRKEKIQDVGNLDWKGPWLYDDATKRLVVTFNGPTQRYWNNGTFTYGDSVEHNYVYSNGRVIAIAPHPVLGACIQEVTNIDGVKEKWVVVMCAHGVFDKCFATQGLRNLKSSELNDELRTIYKRMDRDIPRILEPNEKGWFEMGSSSGYTQDAITSVDPQAPWFFNVNGTEARTMRKCEWSHLENGTVEGGNGDPFEDMTHREMRCEVNISLSPTIRGLPVSYANFILPDTFALMDAPLGMAKWVSGSDVEHNVTTYVQPANESSDGEAHTFKETFTEVVSYTQGRSKVAVDFKPDTGKWVYGWLYGVYNRLYGQQTTLGIDDGAQATPNTDSTVGPLPKPDPYVLFVGNHYNLLTYGDDSVLSFNINESPTSSTPLHAEVALGWEQSGSATVRSGSPPDPNDNVLKYTDTYDTWLQYCDIRHNVVCGYTWFAGASPNPNTIAEIDKEIMDYEETQWALVGVGTGSDADGLMAADDSLYYSGEERSRIFMTNKPKPSRVGYLWIGWTETFRNTFGQPTAGDPFTDTFQVYNWSGNITAENDNEALFAPSWRSGGRLSDGSPTWQAQDFRPLWQRLDIKEVLYGELTQSKGVYGTTELEETLVAIEFLDKTVQDNVSKAHSWGVPGEPLDALDGGDKIRKGGLL